MTPASDLSLDIEAGVATQTVEPALAPSAESPTPLATANATAEAAPDADGRSLGRNIAALSAGQLFTWTMTLSWSMIVPRLLGVSAMGMIFTGMSVANVLQILLGAGTAAFVTREVVVSPGRAARTVAAATLGRVSLFPLFALATLLWTSLAGYTSEQNLVVYLCSAATAVTLLSEPILSYFQATERMHYIAIGNAINKASQGLCGIVLAILGFGALGFAWCWIVTAAVVALLAVRWIHRYLKVHWRTTWSDLRHVAKGSAAYWTGGVFFTIYAWIDSAMLSVMTNDKVVGWYGVPLRLWGTMLVIPTILSTAWLPRLVQAYERSHDELISLARKPIELVFVMSLPVATLVALGASPAIRVIYGPAYVPAIPVLVILGLNLIPMYLNIMLCQICIAANRPGRWTWLMAGATVFNPAINLLLIPWAQHRYGNGAIGAAIALALTEVVIATAAVMLVGRSVVGLRVIKRVARMAAACGGAVLITYLLQGLGQIPASFAGCAALVPLVLLVGGVTAQERAQARALIQKLLRKLTSAASHMRRAQPGGS